MTEPTDIKERIRAAAEAMFMQYGLRSVSMDDIATSLGMSKKTLYQYYADKNELVLEVVTHIMDNNQCNCLTTRDVSENAIHEVFLAMDYMAELFQSMNPALVFEMQKYHPAAYRKFASFKNDFLLSMLKTYIQKGIDEGLFRSDLDVDLLARFRVESTFIAFNPDFYNHTNKNLAAIQQELMLHFLYGKVTPKGYKLVEKYIKQRNKK